jgi:radical SAM superfamily enzyme YgiQ (UPF0313 family)
MTIEASRGCSFRCIFCISKCFGKWKGRSPENICDEIESLATKYPSEGIIFTDLLFTGQKEWVISLCQEIIRRNLKIKWSANGRVNVVDEEVLDWMAKAGCILISYGGEAIRDGILSGLNKDQSAADIERAIQLSFERGIISLIHILVGLPGQDEKMLFEDIRVLEEWICKYKAFIGGFYPLMIFPGTELFLREKRYRHHNWLDEVSPGFIFPNIPIYQNGLIPYGRILELCDKLDRRCRKILRKTTNIINKEIRPKKMEVSRIG